MLLVNPYTGKPVDVADASVDRFTRAGFKEQEPAEPAPRRGKKAKSE